MRAAENIARVSVNGRNVRNAWARLGAVALSLLAVFGAAAQDKVSVEKVHFKVADAFERDAAVVGELRVPDPKGDRLPVVMIVNSAPGFDGRSAFYAEELNRVGIATLELDFMQGRGMPASPRQHMAHA